MKGFAWGRCGDDIRTSFDASRATFTVVFDQDTVTGNASGTLLTLNFGNSTNSATTFTDADFVSRTWTNLGSVWSFQT